MFKTRVKIASAEVVKRRAAISRVRHSTEIEGGRSSDQARALQERWAKGEITTDVLLKRTKALYHL